MRSLLAIVMVLARAPKSPGSADAWASWRWLGTADERVLWAILAGAALFAAWGAWPACRALLGWRRDS